METTRTTSAPLLRPLLPALGGGLTLGVVTALLQGDLGVMDPLVNSAGSWCIVAAVLAVRTHRQVLAAAIGATTLWSLLGGYLLATVARGLSMQTAFVLFWAACGTVGGPIIGVGASWARHMTGWRASLGVAAVAGLLLGEGAYGLTTVADTTGATYWVLEMVAGVGLLGTWMALRRPPARMATSAGVAAVLGGGIFALLARTVAISG